MFRPTHFVILFAVVLCAAALPADPASPAPKVSDPAKMQPVGDSEDKTVADKSDLATDAQTYWSYRYTYNTPVLGHNPHVLTYNTPVLGYVAPGLAARTLNVSPYSWYYGIPAPLTIIEE